MRSIGETKGCAAEEDRGNERLTPDYTFLIKEIVDDLDTITHLRLGPFRHRKNCAHQLTRFHFLQGGDSFPRGLFKILAKASQGNLLVESFSAEQWCFLSHEVVAEYRFREDG